MDEIAVGWLIAGVLTMFVVVVLYRYRQSATVAFIEKPVLGLLDLSDGQSISEVKTDRETLGSLFFAVLESTTKPPKCDVLLLYCTIETDGRIRGSELGLRELIRESGAPVVIVASENSAERYNSAAKKKEYGNANLVMTMNRRGEVFGQFFHKIFSAMKEGASMPLAWVKLVPQIPGKDHPDCPVSLLVCEVGQIAFRCDGCVPLSRGGNKSPVR
jgi:hypothetical protein